MDSIFLRTFYATHQVWMPRINQIILLDFSKMLVTVSRWKVRFVTWWQNSTKSGTKSVVSMIKILRHHRHISMEPFFAWELKVFPIAIKWFDSALARFPDVLNFHNNFDNNQKTIGKMKLSAIYEFARMLPMHFVPAPIVQTRNKRKHSMMTRSRRGNGVWRRGSRAL